MDAKGKIIGIVLASVGVLATLNLGGCGRGFRAEEDIIAWSDHAREAIESEKIHFEYVGGRLSAMLARMETADPPSEKDVELQRARVKASRARIWGLITRTDDAFREYLERHPDAHAVRDEWGHFLADQWLPERAVAAWQSLIERAPGYATAYNNIGTLYTHMGKDMEAVDLFLKSIDLDPTNPEYYFNLATTYSTHRKEVAAKFDWQLRRVFREVLWNFGKARELDPANVDYARACATAFVLAKYFGAEGVADEAVEAWEHYLSIELTPSQRQFGLNHLAMILIRDKGDKKRARGLLEDSLRIGDNVLARDLLKKCEE